MLTGHLNGMSVVENSHTPFRRGRFFVDARHPVLDRTYLRFSAESKKPEPLGAHSRTGVSLLVLLRGVLPRGVSLGRVLFGRVLFVRVLLSVVLLSSVLSSRPVLGPSRVGHPDEKPVWCLTGQAAVGEGAGSRLDEMTKERTGKRTKMFGGSERFSKVS